MKKVKIEKYIPIPQRYPFSEMEVGDSFLLQKGDSRNAVQVAALRYARPRGWLFTVKKVKNGFRCWRLE